MTDQTGIYAIENIRDRYVYVGASRLGFLTRWAKHRSALGRGMHSVPNLQHDWDRHGAGWFKFVPLEVCDAVGPLVHREQFWMDRLVNDGFTAYNRIPATECLRRSSPDPTTVFYALPEAARILRISDRTMGRYLRSGKVKGFNLGGLWRIPKAELDRLKAPGTDESTTD